MIEIRFNILIFRRMYVRRYSYHVIFNGHFIMSNKVLIVVVIQYSIHVKDHRNFTDICNHCSFFGYSYTYKLILNLYDAIKYRYIVSRNVLLNDLLP